MMVVVKRSRNSSKVKFDLPTVQSFKHSQTFYEDSLPFKQAHKTIGFVPGFKCSQCENMSRSKWHGIHSGYCFIHKRIVDKSETCAQNSRSSYKNVNMRN